MQEIKIYLRSGQILIFEGREVDKNEMFIAFRDINEKTYIIKMDEIILYESREKNKKK